MQIGRKLPDGAVLPLAGIVHNSLHGHRMSLDDDHVVADLRLRFDEILADLEATQGWITARVQRPVLILRRLDGVETADQIGPGGRRVATQVARQLAEPRPGRPVERRPGLVPQAGPALAELADGCRLVPPNRGRGTRSSRASAEGHAMTHRHYEVPQDLPIEELPAAAIADLLERGDLLDWQPLARAIRRDPWGGLATAVARLLDAYPRYGTSPLWRAWIDRCRARTPEASRAAQGECAAQPVTLATLRRDLGLTQTQVARRLRMTQSDVSKLERREDARLSTLLAYARALGGRLLVTFDDGETSRQIRLTPDRMAAADTSAPFRILQPVRTLRCRGRLKLGQHREHEQSTWATQTILPRRSRLNLPVPASIPNGNGSSRLLLSSENHSSANDLSS